MQTLDHRMGADGNNTPLVVVAVQGSMVGRSNSAGSVGSGVGEDTSFTLTETVKHCVCYQETAPCLTSELAHQNGNQIMWNGGAVVEEKAYTMTAGSFTQVCEEVAPTIMSRDWKDPALTIYANSGHSKYAETDTPSSIRANGGNYLGGENLLAYLSGGQVNRYVVRRLTPTECAALQVFPRDWCCGLETAELPQGFPASEDEIDFFCEVFETNRKALSKDGKSKSRAAVQKWLQNPHSDSKEYSLWGNGVALPCVTFVLDSIVDYARKTAL